MFSCCLQIRPSTTGVLFIGVSLGVWGCCTLHRKKPVVSNIFTIFRGLLLSQSQNFKQKRFKKCCEHTLYAGGSYPAEFPLACKRIYCHAERPHFIAARLSFMLWCLHKKHHINAAFFLRSAKSSPSSVERKTKLPKMSRAKYFIIFLAIAAALISAEGRSVGTFNVVNE